MKIGNIYECNVPATVEEDPFKLEDPQLEPSKIKVVDIKDGYAQYVYFLQTKGDFSYENPFSCKIEQIEPYYKLIEGE